MTDNPTDQAVAMLAAFASVGVRAFDITLKNLEGGKVGFQVNRSVAEVSRSIRKRLEAATVSQCNVIIRPRPDAALIQLDDLDSVKAAKVAPYAFLVFETSPGNFQAWVSLAGQTLPDDLARRLKHGAGADLSASGATRIAGSLNFKPKYAPAFPRVTITQTAAGRVTTPEALESAGLLAAPLPPPRVSPAISRQYRGPRKWPNYARNLAAAPRNAEGEPDRSNADFVWCMTAIDWGWSVEDTAARLAELSEKAQLWEHYALLTATRAASAVARNRGQGRAALPERRLP